MVANATVRLIYCESKVDDCVSCPPFLCRFPAKNAPQGCALAYAEAVASQRRSAQEFRKRNSIGISYKEGRKISDLFINEQIRDKEVRVIGADGEQLGIMSAAEALKLADEAELDLVKIAPTAKPPVCKIVDYGKYKYEQMRKEKESKKKQHVVEIKEIRLSPNIDSNDLNTKINAAKKFLTKGDRVKVTLRFRGREMAHMANSKHILDDFAGALDEIATVEKAPKVEGRSMTMFLTGKK